MRLDKTKDIESSFKEVIEQNKNYFLVMNYPDVSENESESSIEEEDVFRLMSQLKRIKEDKEKTNILLILNSRGGNPFSAYKMINMIHQKCANLIILIPHRAKSAATLMSLGANIIIMGEQSELGPLDLPLPEHPTKGGGGQLSALDGVKPLSYLYDTITTLAVSDKIDALGLKIRNTGLSVKDSISLALHFSSEYLTPLISQLDPLVSNMCHRSLQIVKIYGSNLLKNYTFRDNNIKIENAEIISHQLVYGFPTHSFAITLDIANELGLNVLEGKKYEKWAAIEDYYELYLTKLNSKMIKLIELKEIENIRNKIKS